MQMLVEAAFTKKVTYENWRRFDVKKTTNSIGFACDTMGL